MLCAYGFVHHSASSEAGVSGSSGQRLQELRMDESTMMWPRESFSGGWDDACAARRLRGEIVAIAGREEWRAISSGVFAKKESYSSLRSHSSKKKNEVARSSTNVTCGWSIVAQSDGTWRADSRVEIRRMGSGFWGYIRKRVIELPHWWSRTRLRTAGIAVGSGPPTPGTGVSSGALWLVSLTAESSAISLSLGPSTIFLKWDSCSYPLIYCC